MERSLIWFWRLVIGAAWVACLIYGFWGVFLDTERPIVNIEGHVSSINYLNRTIDFTWTGEWTRSCAGVSTPRYENDVKEILPSREFAKRGRVYRGYPFGQTFNRPFPTEHELYENRPKYLVHLRYYCNPVQWALGYIGIDIISYETPPIYVPDEAIRYVQNTR